MSVPFIIVSADVNENVHVGFSFWWCRCCCCCCIVAVSSCLCAFYAFCFIRSTIDQQLFCGHFHPDMLIRQMQRAFWLDHSSHYTIWWCWIVHRMWYQTYCTIILNDVDACVQCVTANYRCGMQDMHHIKSPELFFIILSMFFFYWVCM